MFRASQTSLAGMLGAMAQPTTRRAYRSNTMAKYNHPVPVRMYVMSETYAMFGATGLNCLLSTLEATGKSCLLSVVWMNFRFQTGFNEALRIKLRTLYRPISMP